MNTPTLHMRIPPEVIDAARASHPELAYLPAPTVVRTAMLVLAGRELHAAIREAILPMGPKRTASAQS